MKEPKYKTGDLVYYNDKQYTILLTAQSKKDPRRVVYAIEDSYGLEAKHYSGVLKDHYDIIGDNLVAPKTMLKFCDECHLSEVDSSFQTQIQKIKEEIGL